MQKNIFYIVLITGLFLDAITKYLAFYYLKNPISLIGDFLSLKLLFNPGIAFGIPIYPLFLKLITIFLILGIFYYYFKEERKKKSFLIDSAFGCILAGAIGNGVERVLKSEVIDFISIEYFSIFNIADILISLGAILYLYAIYREIKK